MRLAESNFSTHIEIEDMNGLVFPAGRQQTAIWRKSETGDAGGWPLERPKRLTGVCIPGSYHSCAVPRRQGFAVGGKSESVATVTMSWRAPTLGAHGHVPNPHHPVPVTASQTLSVRRELHPRNLRGVSFQAPVFLSTIKIPKTDFRGYPVECNKLVIRSKRDPTQSVQGQGQSPCAWSGWPFAFGG